jgi:3-methyladenine DNA glycosylase AlkD
LDLDEIRCELQALADPAHAAVSQRFFKTGPGEYGHGDRFIGVRVPLLRKLAKRCNSGVTENAEILLASPVHEERMLALLILLQAYEKGDGDTREHIYALYLASTAHINNWDLVDVSAPAVVGGHLWERDRAPLYGLVRSPDLWERRIAVMATFYFIRRGQFDETLRLCGLLLNDPHELLHKASGWMLREVGKRDQEAEEAFLRVHYRQMPRTMLRYAIERFPEPLRQSYLRGTL